MLIIREFLETMHVLQLKNLKILLRKRNRKKSVKSSEMRHLSLTRKQNLRKPTLKSSKRKRKMS
jgi:hypothetical protein